MASHKFHKRGKIVLSFFQAAAMAEMHHQGNPERHGGFHTVPHQG